MCPPKLVNVIESGTYFYDVAVGTGVWKNSGTTANVWITIHGESNKLHLVPLKSEIERGETFARGSINGFVLVTNESLGTLEAVTLEHDNTGENPSWFVENVTIRDRQTEESWKFLINRWLAVEKDDSLIEVTVDNKTTVTFANQVRSRFGRKIADSHLWMSVFSKATSSSFTRVQRASCCLSILFSAMIANAMFYNIGGETEGTIQIGPFKFSLRQIIVGVQSGLIVAPVNILIVLLFKSSKPRNMKRRRYDEFGPVETLVDELRDASFTLPHFFIYLGWFLCFGTTMTAATFTFFYSLMWGKELAEQWISSILVTNAQDIFVLQPSKIMVVVIVISLLLTRKKPRTNDCEQEASDGGMCEDDIDFLLDNPKERYKRLRLEATRQRTKKERRLAGMTKDIVLHLLFVFLLAIVCYGNKNSYRLLMNESLLYPFPKFEKVTNCKIRNVRKVC